MRKLIDNKIFKIIYGALKFLCIFILVLYVAFLAAQKLSNNNSIGGFRVFTIITGSMEPELQVGDVILVQEKTFEDLKLKDVITYESKEHGTDGMIITHRIIDIDNATKKIITKGDANDIEDPAIDSSQVFGKVTYKFTLISLLTKLIRNKYGFYFLIFVPLVLVIFLEIADFVTQPKEEEEEIKEEKKNEKTSE